MNTSHKIRIGIDARLWSETGVGRYIRNLVWELAKIDHTTEYTLFLRKKDFETLTLPGKNFSKVLADIKWHTLAEQREFPRILEKENLDLVHFPYFSTPIFYTGRFILTVHDLILHHFPTGKASTHSWFIYRLKHAAYTYIIAQGARHAQKIIAVSNATKDEIVKHLHIPEEKIVVTYEGVDTKISNINLSAGRNSPIPNIQYPYFLYVGNAYPHKNLERLVEAFTLFKKNIPNTKYQPPNTKLILVGKKDFFYERLKKKVKTLGLEDIVVFKHNISDEELAQLYGHALALVMPSLMEGFGLPILEAMAKGCIVGASDISIFREVAGDVPLYFNPKDTRSIVNVLESIAKGENNDEKERKRKGKEIAKKYSWEEMAKETKKAYEGCLGL